MKNIFNLLILLCVSFSMSWGQQCINNPSIQAGSIMPAPLLNGNGGTLSFTYTENLLDYTDEETDPVTLTICLLNIGPASGIGSIGGTFSGTFDWQYDGVTNCFLGTQNQDIIGGSGGSITVDFVQTNTIDCPVNQMGFNANIQPAACMNGTNQVNDDDEQVFTCNEDSPLPGLVALDTIYNEDAGSVNALVCLDSIVTVDVSFDYTISDGSAVSGMDYTALASSSATILAGDSCATLPLTIIDDTDIENNENVIVEISNPTNADIQDNTGIVTIIDNDMAPVEPGISVTDVTVNEGDNAVVQVCIDQMTTQDVSVNLSTANSSAIAGSDYNAVLNQLVTIPAGDPDNCVDVTIGTIEDTNPEPTEAFLVNLTNPNNGTLTDPTGTVTILDDDMAPVVPDITVTDVTVTEGQNAVVQVCIDQMTTVDVSVQVSTSNGSAIAGSDYNPFANQLVTIPAGDPDNCVDVIVGTIDDTDAESTENMFVNLTNPTNGNLVDPTGQVTILDNDDPCEAQAPVISGN